MNALRQTIVVVLLLQPTACPPVRDCDGPHSRDFVEVRAAPEAWFPLPETVRGDHTVLVLTAERRSDGKAESLDVDLWRQDDGRWAFDESFCYFPFCTAEVVFPRLLEGLCHPLLVRPPYRLGMDVETLDPFHVDLTLYTTRQVCPWPDACFEVQLGELGH